MKAIAASALSTVVLIALFLILEGAGLWPWSSAIWYAVVGGAAGLIVTWGMCRERC